MFTPVLFYLGVKKSAYPSFLLCYNHIASMFDVILTKISLAMKIFKSHHKSLNHALLCFVCSTVINVFKNTTLPIQRVTITQNAFLSFKCAIVLLTLGAAVT